MKPPQQLSVESIKIAAQTSLCRALTQMAVTMDQHYWYEIRVEGHLAEQWSAWFDGLAIHTDPNGETTLTGLLPDQSALLGVLTRIHNLNLLLISVCRSLPK